MSGRSAPARAEEPAPREAPAPLEAPVPLEAMADLWHIGRVEDIPLLEGRATTVAGRRIAVFRLLEGFAALDAACPHAGGPLADGIVADSCVTCPLHGWRFDLHSGEAVGGGASGAVGTHEVIERDGQLYLRLAAASLAAA